MTNDLQIFSNDKASLYGAEPVGGIKKLAQRVVIELFTSTGSMAYLPTRGCSFLSRCKFASTEFDIKTAFAAARSKLRRYFKADAGLLPTSEQLADVLLDEILIAPTTINLSLLVQNKDGEVIRVRTPTITINE